MKHVAQFTWWVVGIIAFAGGLANAQDVTVAPIRVIRDGGLQEYLPTYEPAFRPEFPKQLKKTTEIGWGLIELSVASGGKLTAYRHLATQPFYREALLEAVARGFRRAPDEGAAEGTCLRVTAFFNPASASPAKPEATPRLLEAWPLVDPALGEDDGLAAKEPVIEWVTVRLDASGRPQSVSGMSGVVATIIEPAVRQWRFAPARAAGVPVAASVRVPVILVPPTVERPNYVSPRAIMRVPPKYPAAMAMSGMRGSVLMEFVVDVEGRVRSPVVLKTLNPRFNEAALEALMQWSFEPARENGRPVEAILRQEIWFSITNTDEGGNDGIQMRGGKLKDLPPELRYEVAPKIEVTEQPVYPYALLEQGRKGSATVALLVGPSGHVVWTKVTAATHPEFGLALQAAVERFRYRPALKGGDPTQAMIRFEQEFTVSDADLVTKRAKAALNLERKDPGKIFNAGQLDRKLKRVIVRPPLMPRAFREARAGDALVEFLVDRDGRVLLPRVVSASAPEFGYTAVQAVLGWSFEPPLREGNAVMARVQVPFEFTAPAEPAAP